MAYMYKLVNYNSVNRIIKDNIISKLPEYGVYLKAFPTSLDYDLVTSYVLTIECTDSKTTVSGNFTVTVTENSPPVYQSVSGIFCNVVYYLVNTRTSQSS